MKTETDIYEDSDLETTADEAIVEKALVIYNAEMSIDPESKVYLMTWSPDPKQSPDCALSLQHEFHVNALIDYLNFCKSGIFCLENSQLGEPHYHGWYQVDETNEAGRVVMIKVLQKFGKVKIAKCLEYKINNFKKHRNGLWYYKKDVFDAQLGIKLNPVTKNTPRADIDNSDFAYFMRIEGRKTSRVMQEKASAYKYYREFYGSNYI